MDEAAPTLDDAEAVFFALAHETRRRILVVLARSGGELPSGYLASRFAHSWPTTTRHLHVLEASRLIRVRREGRSSWYCIDRARLDAVVGGFSALLRPPSAEKTWTGEGPRTTEHLKQRTRATNEKSRKR